MIYVYGNMTLGIGLTLCPLRRMKDDFNERTKEADLTKTGGLEYDIRDSGGAKSYVKVVWKVSIVLKHAEHSRSAIQMKMEGTRDLCRALRTMHGQFRFYLTELKGTQESGIEMCTDHPVYCGVSSDSYSPRREDVK